MRAWLSPVSLLPRPGTLTTWDFVTPGLNHLVANPFADVCWAVVQPDAARLAPYEEAHRFTIHELDLLQVEDSRTMRCRLLIDQPLQLRHVHRLDTTSDREAHVLAIGRSLDPQHREGPA